MAELTKPERRSRITAVFRPRLNDIAIMAVNGVEIASSAMTVEQARELHASLGKALRLVDCRDHPLRAVDPAPRQPGGR